jgi:cold shock CspA family protein
MIAYVDENGVITSTPPELNPNKEEIKQEEILISTPKKEELEAPAVLRGRIDYFNESKGYGFIKDLDGAEKYFFHVSNNTLTDISENDIVTFDLERGLRGMNAVNIRIEGESQD